MIDSKYEAWLLEINNSPSLNIMFEKDFMSDEENEISEIDKDIKMPMLTDTLHLARLYARNREALEEIIEYNSLTKIYFNYVFNPNEAFNVLWNLKIIYNSLTGTKGKGSLTNGQFIKLYSLVEHLRLGELQKPDMALIFSSLVGRFKSMMDFTDFKNAMFKLFVKYKGKDIYLSWIIWVIGPIEKNDSADSYEMLFPNFIMKVVEDL